MSNTKLPKSKLSRPENLKEPDLTATSQQILNRRYLKVDDCGRPCETVGDMFWRVARYVAEAEKEWGDEHSAREWSERFYDLMASLDFLPNSPTLLYADRGLKQLSACFVLPLEDSLDSIFTTLKQAVDVQWAGGGTGFNFSSLRPFHDSVRGFPDVAAGPLHYIKVFDSALGRVMQGGVRHGANMAILHIRHPDIEEFISSKREQGIANNFNLSVGVTDQFMKSILKGDGFALVNPRNGSVVRKVRAEQLFDRLVINAWESGEPGLIFWDQIEKDNPLQGVRRIEATNPCGEQPLSAYESCNLGSINLARFVVDDRIDWDRLGEVVKQAVRFLDNVIEVNRFPLPQIKKRTLETRKIGLGVMGLAHLFYQLEVKYDSPEAEKLTKRIMRFVKENGAEQSIKLAEKRGPFPLFKESVLASNRPRRNATITTVAPTGSLSLIAGTSSGIEPVFSLISRASVLLNADKKAVEMKVVDPGLKQVLCQHQLLNEEVLTRIEREGIESVRELPEETRNALVGAHQISPEWHIRIQAAAQKNTDNAVSKTINFPREATIKDIREAFILAWKLGCKGITVYRDQSRKEQVLRSG